jgi:hypothetical protein
MKNDYEIRGEMTAIFIESKGKIYESIIETSDLEKVKSVPNKWFLNDNSYVWTSLKKGTTPLRLHRLISDAPGGLDVDHINGNKLDNRKCNLRLVTRGQNNQNQKISRSNTKSNVRGVAWFSRDKKWRAYVNFNGKQIHLGYFDTKEAAAISASKARKVLMPFSNENNNGGERYGS